MNVNSDDQFENRSMLSLIGDKFSPTIKRPTNIMAAVGSFTVVGFVFANALFLQEGQHPAAMFETRSIADGNLLRDDEISAPLAVPMPTEMPLTRIVLNQNPNPQIAPRPTMRPTEIKLPEVAEQPAAKAEKDDLLELQQRLSELGFYKGTVDGLMGPKTRAAIESYKSHVGLRGIDLTPAELALSARNNQIVTAAIPTAKPTIPTTVPQRRVETVSYTPPSIRTEQSEPSGPSLLTNDIAKVQAGLKAFGNDTISIDGKLGPQTVAAIKEFQSLFNLAVNGEIDTNLLEKMTSVGLIN